MRYFVSIDQSTSATKAMLFDGRLKLLARENISHRQYYPREGWVEHDPEEIYRNTIEAIGRLMTDFSPSRSDKITLSITNQRETVVVWNRATSRPVANAVVWQCMRGADYCAQLREQGSADLIARLSGLVVDPYFSASGLRWILDNVEGARSAAERGELAAGTIDSWLVWRLTEGRVHATDLTNASRTLLMNIRSLDWDSELLGLFDVPRSVLPQILPSDSCFGQTTAEGRFNRPIDIVGVTGDSHGALVGQMCFERGMGKATYGTGSSVMVNIGSRFAAPPAGLVTSVGYAALGKVCYAYEGNIHCTGATIKWLSEQLGVIDSAAQAESVAASVDDNGGTYLVPAFAGLGAPWWNPRAKAAIVGMTLATNRAHIVRAALEAIGYQVKDLVDLMLSAADMTLSELRVDGGPTRNRLLMQFQADMLDSKVVCSTVEEASGMGAAVLGGLGSGDWQSLEQVAALRCEGSSYSSKMSENRRQQLHREWLDAVAVVESASKM